MKYFIWVVVNIICMTPVYTLAQTGGENPTPRPRRLQASVSSRSSDINYDSLRALPAEQVVAFSDSVEQAEGGWAPVPRDFWADSSGNYAWFNRQYYEQSSDLTGKHIFQSANIKHLSTVKPETDLKKVERNPVTEIKYIWPQLLKKPFNKNVEVSLLAAREYDSATVTFSRINSQAIMDVWKGKLLKGNTIVHFDITTALLPSGKYLVLLKDKEGEIIASRRFFIER